MWRVRTIGRDVRLRRLAAAASQCSLERWTCAVSVSASLATSPRPSPAPGRGARGAEGGAHALGRLVAAREPLLAVPAGPGQGAPPPCDDRAPRRHRLERRATRLVGARGHQREAVCRGEDERQVTIAV